MIKKIKIWLKKFFNTSSISIKNVKDSNIVIDKLELKEMTEDEVKEFIKKWNKESQKINNYDIYNGRG